MVKKRILNFLILEVLICFLLLSLSVLPFSSYPYRAFKKELAAIEALETRPYFTQSFLSAYEQINDDSIVLSDLEIPFGKDGHLTLKRYATKKIDSDSERTTSILATVSLTIESKIYLLKRFCR